MRPPSDASTSPTVEEAAELLALSRGSAPQLSQWIDHAPQRNRIPIDAASAKNVDEILPPAGVAAAGGSPRSLSIRNGWIVAGDRLLVGGRTGVMWWRGGIRPTDIEKAGTGITRFVPGRKGGGLTDDLQDVARNMVSGGIALLDHNYGLWYDRRRDDHQRVRRLTGDVWPR